MPRGIHKITAPFRKKFIRLLSETGNISKCCSALNISRVAIYKERRTNKKFAQEWKEAQEQAIGLLEDESWRRAFEGIEKEIWYRGEAVGIERQYSDTLLMHRLQAELPEKYQYRQKVDQNVTGSIKIEIVKFADAKTDDDKTTK